MKIKDLLSDAFFSAAAEMSVFAPKTTVSFVKKVGYIQGYVEHHVEHHIETLTKKSN